MRLFPFFADDNLRLRSNSCYAAKGFSPEGREGRNLPLSSQCESVPSQAQHRLHFRETAGRRQM